MTKPIFIYSLPRSGSTLLQRILASHSNITTTAEPWILLPLIYSYGREEIFTEYDHSLASEGIDNFFRNLPSNQVLKDAQREFALTLYTEAAKGTPFFVDKTPRYSLIAKEIAELFVDAKHIFLWRNPLAVASSILDSWYGGRWMLHRHNIDLYVGLRSLLDAYKLNAQRSLAIRYEDLVTNPQAELERIMNYIGETFEEEQLRNYKRLNLDTKLGDSNVVSKFEQVSSDSLDNWRRMLGSPLRKRWCRNYIEWIGRSQLVMMGYNPEQLLLDIDEMPVSITSHVSDPAYIVYGYIRNLTEMRILKRKLDQISTPHLLSEYL